jgi:hypothetical protein
MITPSFASPVDPTTPGNAVASPSSELKTESASGSKSTSDFMAMFSQKMAGGKHPHLPADPKNSPGLTIGQPTGNSLEIASKNKENGNKFESDNDTVFKNSAEPETPPASPSEAEGTKPDLKPGSLSIPESLLAMLIAQIIPPSNQLLSTRPEAATSTGETGTDLESTFPKQTSPIEPGMAISLPTGFKEASSATPTTSAFIGKDVPAISGQPEKIAASNRIPIPPTSAQISPSEKLSKGDFSLPPELQDELITKAIEAPEPPSFSKPKTASNKPSNVHVLSGGTGVALKTSEMKATVEKNEIAGLDLPKEQNLTSWQAVSQLSADVSQKGNEQETPDISSGKKEAADQSFAANLPGKVELHSSARLSEEESLRPVAHAQQADRISNLISQEVVTMKKLGASSLAVSLKVDNQTELSLRLNNHEGRIHAFVSCERGSVPHLEKHWQELRESLARQNVQLMPLNEKFFSSITNYSSSSSSNQSNQFEDHAQKNPQPRRELPEEMVPAFKGAGSARKTCVKSEILQPLGWEIYA